MTISNQETKQKMLTCKILARIVEVLLLILNHIIYYGYFHSVVFKLQFLVAWLKGNDLLKATAGILVFIKVKDKAIHKCMKKI